MGNMNAKQIFTKSILDYCKSKGMSKRDFGMAAMGDPNFVYQIIKGRSVSLDTVDKVNGFMKPAKKWAAHV